MTISHNFLYMKNRGKFPSRLCTTLEKSDLDINGGQK